jgi:hypothetical protein
MTRTPYEWDSVNYALALDHFSIPDGQPHAPGYLFYVLAGKLLHLFIQNPITALNVLNLVLGVVALTACYRCAKLLSSRRAGIMAAFLFTASPLAWFYGEVAEIYSADAAVSALLGYLFFRYTRDRREISLFRATLALGLSGGFRASTQFFFVPAWLFLLTRVGDHRKKTVIGMHGLLFCLASALWMAPTFSNAGGLFAYLEVSRQTLGPFLSANSLFYGAPPAAHLKMILKLIAWSAIYLGPALFISSLVMLKTRPELFKHRDVQLVWFWFLPAFLFFALIYIAKPGYLLFALPPVIIAAAVLLDAFFRSRRAAALFTAIIAMPGLLYLFSTGVGAREMEYQLQKEGGFAKNAFKRLFRYTLNDLRYADRRNHHYPEQIRAVLKGDRNAVFIFTSYADWNFRFANYYFPDIEAHFFLITPDLRVTAHEHYVFEKLFTIDNPEIQVEGKQVLWFVSPLSHHGRLLASQNIARAGTAQDMDGFYYIPAGKIRRIVFEGQRITFTPLEGPLPIPARKAGTP